MEGWRILTNTHVRTRTDSALAAHSMSAQWQSHGMKMTQGDDGRDQPNDEDDSD